jgi:hypothetical protein
MPIILSLTFLLLDIIKIPDILGELHVNYSTGMGCRARQSASFLFPKEEQYVALMQLHKPSRLTFLISLGG